MSTDTKNRPDKKPDTEEASAVADRVTAAILHIADRVEKKDSPGHRTYGLVGDVKKILGIPN